MISGADPRMVETQCTFVDAAKKAGVRHIVKFSGIGFWDSAPHISLRTDASRHRALPRELRLEWTHLCPSQFMQVYLREAPSITADGTLRLPLGDARLAPIDVEDIAKIAFKVVQGTGHEGKRYEMTGPEALTMTQIAELLSQALGKEVHYVDVRPEEKRKALLAAGMPPAFADAMDELSAHAATPIRKSRR